VHFDGKAVVVFGGGGGIGSASAASFAAAGASIVVADIDKASADDVARSITATGGVATSIAADVTRYADAAAAVECAVSRYGQIDVVFNCAGIVLRRPILEHEPEDFEKVLRVNLLGSYNGILAGARAMHELRIRGCIINTASVAAYVSTSGMVAYHASKGGVRSLTQAAALELAPLGIRVVAVAPGTVDTPLVSAAKAAGIARALARRQMRRRMIAPERVADVVLFLASKEADAINGTVVLVDDGYVGFK
jgi:glucose 1-dehydrogenase